MRECVGCSEGRAELRFFLCFYALGRGDGGGGTCKGVLCKHCRHHFRLFGGEALPPCYRRNEVLCKRPLLINIPNFKCRRHKYDLSNYRYSLLYPSQYTKYFLSLRRQKALQAREALQRKVIPWRPRTKGREVLWGLVICDW